LPGISCVVESATCNKDFQVVTQVFKKEEKARAGVIVLERCSEGLKGRIRRPVQLRESERG